MDADTAHRSITTIAGASPRQVTIRHGRLQWPGREILPGVPGIGSANAVERWRNVVVFAVVWLYLLFNWGFQQVRFPPGSISGLPIGELVLFLSLLTINYSRTLGRFAQLTPILPFAIWWTFGAGRAAFDFVAHGSWALRDAAHVIESLFLIVGFVYAGDRRSFERFFDWLPVLLAIGSVYGLFYPVRFQLLWPISPTVMSSHGFQVPIIGNMVNTPYLMIMAAAYLILFRSNKLLANVTAVLLLGYMIAIFQARTLYLILIAVFGFFALYRRSTIGNLGFLVYFSALLLVVVGLVGVRMQGRLGANFDVDFLRAHFMAIFGHCDPSIPGTCAAAEGVDQRLGWWTRIFERLFADPFTALMGLGYGVVLTDFYSTGGIAVREPHNSYISLVARTGIIGTIAWFTMMGLMYRVWHLGFRRCQALGWRKGENQLLLMMVFYICMWVLALGEDGFEKPYNIIPFYFFWGVTLRYCLHLQRGEIGPEAERHARFEPRLRFG